MTTPHDFLLFDLDGTISDPLLGFARSMNFALTADGFEPLELSACSAHIGPPLDESFTKITGITSPERIKALIAKYRERYADIGYSENSLYPGIAEALAALSAANIPLGICTTKRKDFAERILEMFNLRTHFKFVSGGDIGIEKWQQIEALRARNIVSSSSAMVGDRSIDIVAAKKNGLFSAGVLWGHGTRIELENERPDYLFSTPAELLRLAETEQPGRTP